MSFASLIIGLLMLGLATTIVLAPFRSSPDRDLILARRRPRGPEYQRLLEALRDLDFDHALGIVAAEDYARARTELVSRAAQALQRSARAEPRARARRSDSSRAGTCPRCGKPYRPEHKFCARCGAALTAPRRGTD